jgi:hypothetical protein
MGGRRSGSTPECGVITQHIQEITMQRLIAVAFGLVCLVAAPSLASAQYSFGAPTQSGGSYQPPPPPPYYGR